MQVLCARLLTLYHMVSAAEKPLRPQNLKRTKYLVGARFLHLRFMFEVVAAALAKDAVAAELIEFHAAYAYYAS